MTDAKLLDLATALNAFLDDFSKSLTHVQRDQVLAALRVVFDCRAEAHDPRRAG
jgi:hypothetical protein